MIKLKKVGEYCNKEIRTYLRANPHFTDDMVAEHFNVSTRVISANKAHITMRTDTDNPQARSKVNRVVKSVKKQLTVIKTNSYQLLIDEDGQFRRVEGKKVSRLTDEQAKAVMLSRLQETYNM